MALNGIDVSHWRADCDLSAVPHDFMICKATEGTGFVDSTCDSFVQAEIGLGGLFGFYHFMNEEDAVDQADYFVRHCEGYFGHGIPILDYESYGMQGAVYAKRWLDRVYELTKVKPLIYMSRSVIGQDDWSDVVAGGYDLWVAQYATNDDVHGYQEDPWLREGGFSPWPYIAMHQYTSSGRLPGYSGHLDLNIAYMTRDAWGRYARGDRGAMEAPEQGSKLEERYLNLDLVDVDGNPVQIDVTIKHV